MNEKINADLRQHEEDVEDWDLAGMSSLLYRIFDRINERFFGGEVPVPVISFKSERRTRGGHYVIGRNEVGVKENININRKHLSDPLQKVVATLAHEVAHCYQFNYGEPGSGNYHNKAFREKVESMGIPCTKWGKPLGIREPFLSFLRELGIDAKLSIKLPETQEDSRSGASLRTWECPCETKIYATGNVAVRCLQCGGDFVLKSKK